MKRVLNGCKRLLRQPRPPIHPLTCPAIATYWQSDLQPITHIVPKNLPEWLKDIQERLPAYYGDIEALAPMQLAESSLRLSASSMQRSKSGSNFHDTLG